MAPLRAGRRALTLHHPRILPPPPPGHAARGDWKRERAEDAAYLALHLGYDPASPELLDRVVADQAADLEWLLAVEKAWPIAVAVLWRNETALWDQRRAIIAAMTCDVVALILGGERSGKTFGMLCLDVADALGHDHPAIRSWMEVNDLPADETKLGPDEVWITAPSSAASVEYHRETVADLVGDKGHWNNRLGKGPASLRLDVPGYRRGATLRFKAAEQGHQKFKGASVRRVHPDEELEGEEGRRIYAQARARVLDQQGHVGLTMVPLLGLTWVHDDFVRDGRDNVVIVKLDALDNPYLVREDWEAVYKYMDADELAQKRFGEFRSRSGLIYPQWTEGDGNRTGPGHLCEPFDIPENWPRYRAADFGFSDQHAMCVLWGAVDPSDDVLYIYRELFKYHRTAEEVADEVALLEAGERIQWGWGDPNEKGSITVFNMKGLQMSLAHNEVRLGIDAVRNRLRHAGNNRPRVKVFRTAAPQLCRGMGGYVWAPNGKDPLKRHDDAVDTLRYLIIGIDRLRGFGV